VVEADRPDPEGLVHVEPIDHTADVGVRVRAPSPAEAFACVAAAMFDFMVEREGVAPERRWSVRLEAEGWEDLLVAWLEELLYRYESEGVVPRTFHISEIASTHLVAEIEGEYLDPARHETRSQIKAVTYHQLRAEETGEGFVVQVIFDI